MEEINSRKRKRNVDEKISLKKPKISNISVSSIDDLIKLGFQYNTEDPTYNSSLYKNIYNIIPPLMELNQMIGLTAIKKKIIDQIIYFIQNLHQRDNNNHFLNTVITGAPGTGKTTIATIIGKIYFHLGFLPSSKITYGKRTDFLANYLGQTANKTLKFLKDATPGILIIDEVYSLGNEEKRNSFAKEAIDTINQYLSENKDKLVCIVMGYKADIEACFFNYNQGLQRRFPFTYDIENYLADDLQHIFLSMVRNNNWKIAGNTTECVANFFTKHANNFTSNGGDVENLIFYCKNAHSLNLFIERLAGELRQPFHLTLKDITDGFNKFEEDVIAKKQNKLPDAIHSMFS